MYLHAGSLGSAGETPAEQRSGASVATYVGVVLGL